MRSGAALGQDGAPGVTRRVVRLLVLFGAVVAAYLVLSLFDHAARADSGSIDQIGASDPVASVKAPATQAKTGGKKVVRESKAIGQKSHAQKSHAQKSHAQKPHAQKPHRPTIKVPDVKPPKIQAAKKATTKLRHATSHPVRNVVRPVVTPARTAVVRQKLPQPVHLTPLPGLSKLPHLPQAQLPALPQPPSAPQLLPVPMPVPVPAPQLPTLPQARTPELPRSTALLSTPTQPLLAPVTAGVETLAPASGLSDTTKPPAAEAQPQTAPLPAPSRQPADHPTTTGQARDSSGGNAPSMGTVLSSWRPEVTAAGRRLATHLTARGRTVRYAGPPS